jgi:phenylacetate-coenzyme A ligase PaaK-like adenylate-forming protein
MCSTRRQHVYEDLVIVEPVDADYRPVPHGVTGDRILVTVLFSRTLPLIRYEMSDEVRLDGRGCPCGRSFELLTKVEGRAEEVLHLPVGETMVAVHPNVFHVALEDAPVTGWQVVQRPDGLDVLLAGLPLGTDLRALRDRVMLGLAGAGVVGTPVNIIPVHEIQRTALGKAPLVKAAGH